MQIHELNPFQGTLGSEAFLVVDNGDDTGKISVERLTQPINDRIDDIITSPAPTEQEIIDARRGWNEVVYGSLGTAIRSQVKQILAQFYKFNTYDLLGVYGTPISRTRNGVTFTWDDAGQVCEVSGEAVGGDAYASIYTQTGAWQGIFERGVTYTVGYETTDPNVKLRIAVWEGVETTPDYYYFDEDGHFGIPPEAAKIGIDLYVASGDTVSAVVKNVYMLRTYTAKEVTATIRDAMIGADLHMYNSLGDAIREQLNGKVDKVTGKALSSNDFTDAEKTKLSGIEAGSEVNAIEAIKLDGTELTPDANRAVNIPVDETLTVEGVPADAKTVGEELKNKLAIDGYSELATVGNAEQLVATQHITDTEPYIYRKTGGPNDVGDRVYDEIVGGSVVWNQLIENGDFSDGATGWSAQGGTLSVSNKVATVTCTGTNSYYIGKDCNTQAGHKYLVRATLQATEEHLYSSSIAFGWGTGQNVNIGVVPTTKTTYNKILAPSADGTRLSIYATSSSNATIGDSMKYSKINVIDLTAAVGSTIADYVYSLETATAGAGVAWFRKYFPKEYHAYCELHFEHVQTSGKVTVGFNQWDEEWEIGSYNGTTGAVWNTTDRIRSKSANYIDVLPNTVYCIYSEEWGSGAGKYFGVLFYDGEKTFLSYVDVNNGLTFTTPSNARYVRFSAQPSYGTTYKNDICLNISGDRDGEYEAYKKRTYPIEPKVLRGVPKLDSANRLYFDGDIYRHDGSGEQKYDLVDLGTLTYQYVSGNHERFSATLSGVKKSAGDLKIANIICTKYAASWVNGVYNHVADKIIAVHNNSDSIWIYDSDYTDAATFKTAMSGVYLVYEKATPEPFTAEPFQSPMVVDPLGTEEFVDYGVEQGDRDVAIPVGHKSEYPADLRGKLQHLPSLSTSGDGRYVVVQTGNQMSLTPDTSLGLIAALEARVAALEGGNG